MNLWLLLARHNIGASANRSLLSGFFLSNIDDTSSCADRNSLNIS